MKKSALAGALAILCILAGYTLYLNLTKFELPVYPNSTKIKESTAAGWTTSVHSSDDPPENILNFFREELKNRGWEVVGQRSVSIENSKMIGLSWIKENVQVAIAIEAGAGKSTIYISIGPPEKVLPQPGLENVGPAETPIYPNSEKIKHYSPSMELYAGIYYSPDDPIKILDFYRAKMAENGWILVKENMEEMVLVFEKGDKVVSIQIGVAGESTYGILFWNKLSSYH